MIERSHGTTRRARIYRASVAECRRCAGHDRRCGEAPATADDQGRWSWTCRRAARSRNLDNVEGITLGPKLSDGRQSVVLVSDDNFSPQQITQFLAFALQ